MPPILTYEQRAAYEAQLASLRPFLPRTAAEVKRIEDILSGDIEVKPPTPPPTPKPAAPLTQAEFQAKKKAEEAAKAAEAAKAKKAEEAKRAEEAKAEEAEARKAKPPAPRPPAPEKPPIQPTIKPDLIIKRTHFPKWWNDEGVAAIALTSPGSQFVITARGDYQLFIGAIVLTVSGECNITFFFGSAGQSGPMDLGGADEPRGMVIAMGNAPAPCGTGSFMVTATSDEAVNIGGFVSYFLWKKDTT